MKKGSIFEQPAMLVLSVAIAAVIIMFVVYLLIYWGGPQTANITKGLEVAKYV